MRYLFSYAKWSRQGSDTTHHNTVTLANGYTTAREGSTWLVFDRTGKVVEQVFSLFAAYTYAREGVTL